MGPTGPKKIFCPLRGRGGQCKGEKMLKEPKQQALTFGFSFPTLLGLLPTVVLIIYILIIAQATVGK